jgi:glutamate synthase (NADPH/NADH) large chain
MTDQAIGRRRRQFVDFWRAESVHLARNGLYDPTQEHDACGVGLVASIDGQPRREVVEAGVEALKAVWHRGAVDADGKTGDGAGIHLQMLPGDRRARDPGLRLQHLRLAPSAGEH